MDVGGPEEKLEQPVSSTNNNHNDSTHVKLPGDVFEEYTIVFLH